MCNLETRVHTLLDPIFLYEEMYILRFLKYSTLWNKNWCNIKWVWGGKNSPARVDAFKTLESKIKSLEKRQQDLTWKGTLKSSFYIAQSLWTVPVYIEERTHSISADLLLFDMVPKFLICYVMIYNFTSLTFSYFGNHEWK